MFADKTASQVGDILTIIVSESTTMKNEIKTTTDKVAGIDNTVTQFLYSAAVDKVTTVGGEFPKTKIDGKNTYTGGGKIENSNTLNARAAVTVIDVLPNGNLVIEGARMISYSGETRFAILRGVVRPYDISTENTVASTNIADAQVEFISEGELTDAQKKGWLLRFNDFVNPF